MHAALALAACTTPAAIALRDGGAVDAGIGAGDECPTGMGCADGLDCFYLLSRNDYACTRMCGSFADCATSGFRDGCCAYPGVDAPPICMPASWGLCEADAGVGVDAGIGAGEECPTGVGCADGLTCWYSTSTDRFSCTHTCGSFDDCADEAFRGGCCASPGGEAFPLCMTATSGACPSALGPGEACPTGTGCADPLACWYLPSLDRFSCTTECGSFDDCRRAGFADGCCFSGGGANGPLPPLCMTAASGICPPNGGAPSGR